jgi:hypothetical protein
MNISRVLIIQLKIQDLRYYEYRELMSYGLNLIVILLPGHLGECELDLLYSFAANLVLVAVPRTLCKSDWDNGLGA